MEQNEIRNKQNLKITRKYKHMEKKYIKPKSNWARSNEIRKKIKK